MRNKVKRALSYIFAFAITMSCAAVINVSSILAAEITVCTYIPDAENFKRGAVIQEQTPLEFTHNLNYEYLTAKTGCAYIQPNDSGLMSLRQQDKFTSHVTNADYSNNAHLPNDSGISTMGTCIVLNVKQSGYFAAWLSGAPGCHFYIFDNTDDKDLIDLKDNSTDSNYESTYEFGPIFLNAGHEYIFYNTAKTLSLEKMEFTPEQTIATKVTVTGDDGIPVENFKISDSNGKNIEADDTGNYNLDAKAKYMMSADGYTSDEFIYDGSGAADITLTKLPNTLVFYTALPTTINKITLTKANGEEAAVFDLAKADFYNAETNEKIERDSKGTATPGAITISAYSADRKYKLNYVCSNECQIKSNGINISKNHDPESSDEYFYINTPEKGCNISVEFSDNKCNELYYKDVVYDASTDCTGCELKHIKPDYTGEILNDYTLCSDPKPEIGKGSTVIGTDGTVYYIIGISKGDDISQYKSIGLQDNNDQPIENTNSDTVYTGVEIEGHTFEASEFFNYKYIIGYEIDKDSIGNNILSDLSKKYVRHLTLEDA